MFESLQDEVYQSEIKQAKRPKLYPSIRWELEGEKLSKSFSKVLERQSLQNQTISKLYTDDSKPKCSNNPKDVFKKLWKKLYPKKATS